MYIMSMAGETLASFNKWDIKSVAMVENWIKDHGYYIWKCEIFNGEYYIIVRR